MKPWYGAIHPETPLFTVIRHERFETKVGQFDIGLLQTLHFDIHVGLKIEVEFISLCVNIAPT